MNRFIRYWNANRKEILITILVVAFAILLIKAINYILGQQTETTAINRNNIITDISIPTESVITGESLSDETTNLNMDVIQQFIAFCNDGDYQNAYNVLSNDCKEEVFRTLDEFKTNYYDKVFNTKKTYELELWYSNSGNYTYRIIYYNDNILSTGSLNTSNNVEDYITIVTENDEKKININGFISKEAISKSNNRSEIEITVNEKLSYRDYEIYSITVENNTDKTMMLSEGNNNDICLIDDNETEYDSIMNEIPLVDLQVQPYSTKTIDIKFNKLYGEDRMVEQILFKNIILNIDENSNESENTSKIDLSVNI